MCIRISQYLIEVDERMPASLPAVNPNQCIYRRTAALALPSCGFFDAEECLKWSGQADPLPRTSAPTLETQLSSHSCR
ncbi:hypothetical protein PhaeoP70_03745 (plasmid) [Phaeobacter inhibens]|nr:hypothetical protein PhaeoP74_03747 [Phaeobacter inhibens]AUR17539.1 hypothetical protein PhaeoP70_03745 [Phaeobacter inhibens]